VKDQLTNMALNLERMLVLYERVLSCLEQERRSLIALDYETLQTTLIEKDEVIAALRALDRDRLRLQDQCAILLDRRSADVTLKDLAEAMLELGGAERELGMRLMDLRGRVLVAVDRVKEKVLSNQGFLEKSIENLRGIAEHLSSALTGRPGPASRQSGVYTAGAKYQKSQTHTGGLLEKRL
jgi:flagellar biosynthesis/type III secretory pathway chaperone